MSEREEIEGDRKSTSLLSSLRPLYYCGAGLSLGYLLDNGKEESWLENVVDGAFIGLGYMIVDDLFRGPFNKMDSKEMCILYLGSVIGQFLRNAS